MQQPNSDGESHVPKTYSQANQLDDFFPSQQSNSSQIELHFQTLPKYICSLVIFHLCIIMEIFHL